MPFSSDLFADNDALEPSRTPHIPVSERYSVGGYEVLSGRSGNFSCHTVLSGEVWKMGTEEKLALLREGIQKFSDADKLHMMLGQLHEEQNQVEEARAAYR